MKTLRMIALFGLGLSVSACAAVDVPTRNAPFENLPPLMSSVQAPSGMEQAPGYVGVPDFTAKQDVSFAEPAPVAPVAPMPVRAAAPVVAPAPAAASATLRSGVTASAYHVNTVTVIVPQTLEVSEKNSFFPGGDIVWREDPIGNRHAQVQAIVQDAMLRGASQFDGARVVNIEVTVRRFHALSEKARAAAGGVHNIVLDLSIRDAATGELVRPTKTIKADLEALGGKAAAMAEARGHTQKVRITGHLAEVLRQEMTNPDGYAEKKMGIMSIFSKG